jgi:hypothetical protein
VPWTAKEARAFFRGRRNEHARAFVVVDALNGTNSSVRAASRSTMVALSGAHAEALDAAFVEGEGAAEEVPIREHARRKYLLALDGVTGSFRLSRLLWCNSLLLKEASPWQEYFYRGLTPGVHYQTVFDTAPDDVLRVLDRARADDAGAQRVALAGQAFAARYLCPRARMAYLQAALEAYVGLFEGDAMGTYARERAWPAAEARMRGDAALAALGMGSSGG